MSGLSVTYAGLTARDYFAGLAMQAMLANPATKATSEDHIWKVMKDAARYSCAMADLMLEELQPKAPNE